MKKGMFSLAIFILSLNTCYGIENNKSEKVEYRNKTKGARLSAYNENKQIIGRIDYYGCHIFNLEVDEKYRKQGIGSLLFHTAIRDMQDCQQIRWFSSYSAIDFYRKQGAVRQDSDDSYMYITPMYITPEKSTSMYQSKNQPHPWSLKRSHTSGTMSAHQHGKEIASIEYRNCAIESDLSGTINNKPADVKLFHKTIEAMNDCKKITWVVDATSNIDFYLNQGAHKGLSRLGYTMMTITPQAAALYRQRQKENKEKLRKERQRQALLQAQELKFNQLFQTLAL